MRLQPFLDRNRGELGAPLATYRNRPGTGTVLAATGIWVVCCALFAISGQFSALQVALIAIVLALIAALVLALLAAEVLVVCERGLVVGAADLIRTPYVVRYDQISVGTLVPVTNARRYRRTTRTRGRTSTVRNLYGQDLGIHFVGPSPREASRSRGRAAGASAPIRSLDRRWIWFTGTGSAPPAAVTAQIAAAAHRLGLSAFAAATANAPVRELTGRPGDRHWLLPGFAPT